jgi:hypothetical protein
MTAQPQGFDPVQFKETTREQWERVADELIVGAGTK